MRGENAFDTEDKFGKQDAKKFLRVKKLPPVLQINLNRFDIDCMGDMIKVNSKCEFGETLDID